MSLLGFATRGCCRPSCGRTDPIREIDAGPWKNESNVFENERLERFATAIIHCSGVLHGQHLCHGPRGDPQEEDCGGRREPRCDPLPLHSEYEPHIPI